MVLAVEEHLRTEGTGDVMVDHGMVGGGVAAHELHRLPVLAPRLAVEVEPGEMAQLLGKLGVEIHRQAAEVARHRGAGTAAAAVAEQCQVLPGRQAEGIDLRSGSPGRRRAREDLEIAVFDEVIAAAAGAELGPGAGP